MCCRLSTHGAIVDVDILIILEDSVISVPDPTDACMDYITTFAAASVGSGTETKYSLVSSQPDMLSIGSGDEI